MGLAAILATVAAVLHFFMPKQQQQQQQHKTDNNRSDWTCCLAPKQTNIHKHTQIKNKPRILFMPCQRQQ